MPEAAPPNEKQLNQQQLPNQHRGKTTRPPSIPKSAAEAAAAVKAAIARTSAARKQPQAKAVSLSLRLTPQVEQKLQRRQWASRPSTFSTPAVTGSSFSTSVKGKSTKSGTGVSFGTSTDALWLNTERSRLRLGRNQRQIDTGAVSEQIVETPPGLTSSATPAAAETTNAGELGGSSLCLPALHPRLSETTHSLRSSLISQNSNDSIASKSCNLVAGLEEVAAPDFINANNAPADASTPTASPKPAVTPEKDAITLTQTSNQPAKAAEEIDVKESTPEEESNDENDEPCMAAADFDQNPMNKVCQRLRRALNMRFRPSNLETIEENMHLIRLRKHPTQLYTESRKLVELGIQQSQQIIDEQRVSRHLATIKAKKPSGKNKNASRDEGDIDFANYPEWITFKLRIKREDGDKAWNAYVQRRRDAGAQGKGSAGGKQPTDKYNEKYIDMWTRSLTVKVRPNGILRDIVSPVHSRLGLENRADFQVNVGNFPGDNRPGPKVIFNGQVSPMTPVSQLYDSGIMELFITPWPGLFNLMPPGFGTSNNKQSEPGGPGEEKASKKKIEKKPKNQSNESLVRSGVQANQLAAAMQSLGRSSVLLPEVSNSNATRMSRTLA